VTRPHGLTVSAAVLANLGEGASISGHIAPPLELPDLEVGNFAKALTQFRFRAISIDGFAHRCLVARRRFLKLR
jgi:hypothetical protein